MMKRCQRLYGIKIFPYKVKVLVLSALFAGLAGALQGSMVLSCASVFWLKCRPSTDRNGFVWWIRYAVGGTLVS
jgi:ABC-type branched-subunit amino acid transport system permease subunit